MPRGGNPQYAFYRPPTKRLYRKLEGWLWKKGPNGVISGWKRRYFSLRDNRLYYAVDTQADPINYILLTAETEIEVPSSTVDRSMHHGETDRRFSSHNAFHLRTPWTKRVFVLAVENPDEIERWVEGVREVVKLLADRYSLHKDFIHQYILPPDEDDVAPAQHSDTTAAAAAGADATTATSKQKELPRSVAVPLGPSSARPVVDLLITHAHLDTHHKLAHAAGRAGIFLELSLGQQSLRTWTYQHRPSKTEGHVESSRESRRPEDQRDSLRPPLSPTPVAYSSDSFPWAGVGCTFTKEGSGEDIMKQGRVKVALWQVGGLGSTDALVDEQWIDLAAVHQGETEEFTLAFLFPSTNTICTFSFCVVYCVPCMH
jgi:hypothetical protein